MSKDLLLKIFQKVEEKGVIDDEFIKYLDNLFSDKSINIFDVIQRGFIKYTYKPSNKIVWGVKAKNLKEEYLIFPKLYCSCWDFYKRVVMERKRAFCKHLLAQTICEALESFEEIELKDNDYFARVNSLKLKF